jgi:hypothetical protein
VAQRTVAGHEGFERIPSGPPRILGCVHSIHGRPSATPIFQVKIRLVGLSPPIWRRVLVAGDIRLDRFHEVIQAAMGWMDGHMHVFIDGADEYGLRDPELGHRDERRVTLDRVLAHPKDRIRYVYDFGDNWEHEIVLEAITAADPDARYPICVTGKRACPPEDCGGPWGYAELLEVLADSDHSEHSEMVEWLGFETAAEFDAERVDLDEVNYGLALCAAPR